MSETAHVKLHVAICSDLARLRVLLDDYLRELSDGQRGAADYHDFGAYWSEAGRIPYSIESRQRSVGFALVRTALSTGREEHELAEFFVIPEARRRGIGRAAALDLFRLHPGTWRVETSASAAGAAFWRSLALHEGLEAPRIQTAPHDAGAGLRFLFTALS